MTNAEPTPWEKKLTDIRLGAVARGRTAAKDWLQTISALTSVSAVLGVLQFRESIGKLLPDIERLVFQLVATAFTCAVFAITAAALGAQGTTEYEHDNETAYRAWADRTLQKIRFWILTSRVLTLVATLLLAAALTLAWRGDKKAPEPKIYVAVAVSGPMLCGSLEADPGTGAVRLKPTAAGPTPVVGAVALTEVPTCATPPPVAARDPWAAVREPLLPVALIVAVLLVVTIGGVVIASKVPPYATDRLWDRLTNEGGVAIGEARQPRRRRRALQRPGRPQESRGLAE